MPKKRCNAAGCYKIAVEGSTRCEKHTVSRNKEVQEIRRSGNNEHAHIYNSRAWRRLSQKKRTITPHCEDCMEETGKFVMANVVDHIVELSDGGEPYDWENLRSLCFSSRAEDRKRA